MKTRHIVWLMVLFFLILTLGYAVLLLDHAHAEQTVTLGWEPNSDKDLGGYKVYSGNLACDQEGPMQRVVDVGNVTTYEDSTIPDSWMKVSYWITAYDTSPKHNESIKSATVCKDLQVGPTQPNGLRILGVWMFLHPGENVQISASAEDCPGGLSTSTKGTTKTTIKRTVTCNP